MGYLYSNACRGSNENKVELNLDNITFSDLCSKYDELTKWCKENVSGGFYVSIDLAEESRAFFEQPIFKQTSLGWKNAKDMKKALKYHMFDVNIVVYFINPDSALLFKLAFG